MKPYIDYRESLMERLRRSPEEAAAYLNAARAEGQQVFLVALKDVVDAHGGPTAVAPRAGKHRVSLHKMLSEEGNPTLKSLEAVLDAAGLRLVVQPKDASREAS